MKREKAQTLFEAGAVMACAVIPAPMKGAGYIMQIQRRDGHEEALETTRKGQTRVFRTLDAAANEAHVIGFRQIQVYL